MQAHDDVSLWTQILQKSLSKYTEVRHNALFELTYSGAGHKDFGFSRKLIAAAQA